jgi:aspartokinase/homoserine dehydrogenase 1
MPGFISSSSDGITTLGRGGSDYTAAIMAGALDATDLEIWLMSMAYRQSKIVKQAQPIASISYQEDGYLILAKVLFSHYSAVLRKKYSYSYQEYFRTRSGRHVYFKHFYF